MLSIISRYQGTEFEKDPIQRQILQEREKRVKAVIDQACENSEHLKEVRDVFWTLRQHNDDTIRTLLQVEQVLDNELLAPTSVEIEEVVEQMQDHFDNVPPLNSAEREPGSSKRSALEVTEDPPITLFDDIPASPQVAPDFESTSAPKGKGKERAREIALPQVPSNPSTLPRFPELPPENSVSPCVVCTQAYRPPSGLTLCSPDL